MPSHDKRARRRRRGAGILPALIVLLAIVAAALTLLLVRSDPLGRNENGLPFEYTQSPDFAEPDGSTAAPLVLGGSAAPTTTPTQSAAPAESTAPAESALPAEGGAPAEAAEAPAEA